MPIVLTEIDKKLFLKDLSKALEQLAFRSDFEVQQLCERMEMSRSSLHRKIRATADRSTSIYIREFRLKKAHKLVLLTELPIKNIAFSVGFTDLAYFSKCFKLLYGVSPRKLR